MPSREVLAFEGGAASLDLIVSVAIMKDGGSDKWSLHVIADLRGVFSATIAVGESLKEVRHLYARLNIADHPFG